MQLQELVEELSAVPRAIEARPYLVVRNHVLGFECSHKHIPGYRAFTGEVLLVGSLDLLLERLADRR